MRVAGGDAAQWVGLCRVWIERPAGSRMYEVEHDRAYSDRLVLKLRGIDDANAAEDLRGGNVCVLADEAPQLPAGAYYAATLVGMQVEDESGDPLGEVREVLPTGGTDLLVVERGAGQEALIPLAQDIVIEISTAERRIRVRPPAGLLEVNLTPAAGEESG